MSEESQTDTTSIESIILNSEKQVGEDPPKEQAIVSAAKEKGWTPDKEEFIKRGGAPEDYIDNPEVYLARGPLMKQITQLNKKLNAVAEYNQTLVKNTEKAELAGYERALAEQKAARAAVYATGDETRISKLERDIVKTEENIKKQVPKALDVEKMIADIPDNVASPEAKAFIKRNAVWWGTDGSRTSRAVALDSAFRQLDPLITPKALYEKIDAKLAEEYDGGTPLAAEDLEPKKTKVSYVAPGNRGSSQTGTHSLSFSDLSDEAKDVFTGIKKIREMAGKKFTVDEFIAEARRVGSDKQFLRGDNSMSEHRDKTVNQSSLSDLAKVKNNLKDEYQEKKSRFEKDLKSWSEAELKEHFSAVERFYAEGAKQVEMLGDLDSDPNWVYHWHTYDGNDYKMQIRQQMGWQRASLEDADKVGLSRQRLEGDTVVEMSHNSHRAVLLKIPRELHEINRLAVERIQHKKSLLDHEGKPVNVRVVAEDDKNVVVKRDEPMATINEPR